MGLPFLSPCFLGGMEVRSVSLPLWLHLHPVATVSLTSWQETILINCCRFSSEQASE